MMQLTVFIRKEFLGGWRNKKIVICGVIFVIVGILSPFLAKIMPDIFSSMVTEGIQITVSIPTSVDSWLQFYGNIGSLGLLVFMILFADTICAEIEKGTLINLITKGLSRQTILFSKALYLYCLWTLFYGAAFLICQLYTRIYFDDSLTHQLGSACFSYWLFGIFAISLLLLGSTFAKNVYQVLLFLAACYGMGVLLHFFDSFQKINPYSLSSQTIAYIQGESELKTFVPAVLIAFAGSLLSLVISRSILQKRKL
jgi:ABC-2 type transport system permease protein